MTCIIGRRKLCARGMGCILLAVLGGNSGNHVVVECYAQLLRLFDEGGGQNLWLR